VKERRITNKASDGKAITHHLPQADRCPSQSPSNGYLPQNLLLSVLLLSMTLYSVEYPFGQPGPAVQVVSPTNPQPTPSPLTAGAEWEKRRL